MCQSPPQGPLGSEEGKTDNKMDVTKSQIFMAQNGDSVARDTVLGAAFDFLFSFIATHIDCETDAEDLAQEALIDVERNLSSYDVATDGFDDWMAVFAWNRITVWQSGAYKCGKRCRKQWFWRDKEVPLSDVLGDLNLEDVEGEIGPDRIIA